MHAILAMSCYLPLVLSSRGRVASDTRQAIYLDPAGFPADALSLWDPGRALGTVTHQNIGLFWPMGAWFWSADRIGVPMWVAQRFWLGSILFAAGSGVLFLARTLDWWPRSATTPDGRESARRPKGLHLYAGPVVAAFAYAFSPFVLQYGTRTSVQLLPWAALPWLVALTQRSLTTRGWRHPALIALVVLTCAENATTLALALLGPLCWVGWQLWGAREVDGPTVLRAAARILVLGVPTSAWWMVALIIEGRYGLPLLDYTETIDQVSSTSSATEVLRGLGYWVPYLRERGFAEVTGAGFYLSHWPILAIGFTVVGSALSATWLVRWRYLSVFGLFVVVGVVVGVGAYPPGSAGPLGRGLRELAQPGGAGLALRSTSRAAPVALLGLAALLGVLAASAMRRAPRVGTVSTGALVAVLLLISPSIGGGDLVDPLYSRAEEIPDYWIQALSAADEGAHGGRLLEIPGSRYAAYSWGNTYEPIAAPLATTPSAWREQVPYGSPGSTDMLVSLDNRIQEGRLDPRSLAPVARLMGASTLVVRNDLDIARYETVPPEKVWQLVQRAASGGLGPAEGFGPRVGPGDESGLPGGVPSVGVVRVTRPPGLVSQSPLSSTVVLDGRGEGIVDAAGAGVIDGSAPVIYAQTAAEQPGLLDRLLAEHAPLVLTDSNRRSVERWRSVRDTRGITLRADQDPDDESGRPGGEAPLRVLAPRPEWQTVAAPRVASVSATRYGHPLLFEGAVRPAAALDGDLATAWQVGPYVGGVGDRLEIRLDRARLIDQLQLRTNDSVSRLSEVAVKLDDGAPIPVTLGADARSGAGQIVRFHPRSVQRIGIELRAAETPAGVEPGPIGLAEVGLTDRDGRRIITDEVVRLPVGLVQRVGRSTLDSPLAVVLTRRAGDPDARFRFEEEPSLLRRFEIPGQRLFSVSGRATSRQVPADASCRADLLSLDGVPVWVRVRPSSVGGLDLSGCAPMRIGSGAHLLRSAAHADVDIDQVVLTSAAGGAAGAVDADNRPLPFSTRTEGSLLTKLSRSSAQATTRVKGPSWVVLGQSRSGGWRATVRGAGSVGPNVLMNGYANGFLVDAPPGTPIDFEWRPQRAVDVALWLAAVGVLLCSALVVLGRRWSAPDTASVPPSRARPPGRNSQIRSLRLAIGSASLAGLIVGPLWAPAAAVLGWLGSRRGAGRRDLQVVGSALVVARAGLGGHRARRTRHDAAVWVLHRADRPSPGGPSRPRPARCCAHDCRTRRDRQQAAPMAKPTSSSRFGPAMTTTDHRRFLLACAGGAAPSLLIFIGILARGGGGMFGRPPLGDFYDAQAHALIGGRLDIDRSVLGIEAFVVDGRSYMYQGPFPALLRLPLSALTDRFDGRLTGLSMVLGFMVASAAVSLLVWELRQWLRPGIRVSRAEMAATAGLVSLCSAGTAPVFLASQPSVYHESAMWGMAWTVAALSCTTRFLRIPSRAALIGASVATGAAMWSRASVGVGAAVALGLVAVRDTLRHLKQRRGGTTRSTVSRPSARTRRLVGLIVACTMPVVAYGALNQVKFGSPLSVPWTAQELTRVSTARQEFLDANHETFFGPQFLPTTLLTYLRPDGAVLMEGFPWVGFPESRIGDRRGPGDVLLDKVDAVSSIPVTFHALGLLTMLGVGGVVAAARRRRSVGLLLIPLTGGLVSAATIFIFGFIAQRYLIDVVPLMVLGGAVGFHSSIASLSSRHGRRPARALVGVLVAVAALGSWTAVSQTLWYQAVYASPGDETAARRFFEERARLPGAPLGRSDVVGRGSEVPAQGRAGELFVVGNCDGLYVSSGKGLDQLGLPNWRPIQRSPSTGAHDLDVTFGLSHREATQILLSGHDQGGAQDIVLERLTGRKARFSLLGAGLDVRGAEVSLVPGRRYHLELVADRATRLAQVRLDGRVVLTGIYAVDAVPKIGWGPTSTDGSPDPRWRERPVDRSTCRHLAGDSASG